MGYINKPTRYAGLVFRSRHDAQWAAFFDACGWRWEYEPWDNGEIPPTFLLWFESPLYVLVRPVADEELQLHLAEIVSRYGRENRYGILYPNVLLLDLAPPLNNRKLGGAKIGLVGTSETGWPRFIESPGESLSDANLSQCAKCHGTTLVATSAHRRCLRCGSRKSGGLLQPIDWRKARARWHRAKSAVNGGATI